MTNQMFTMITFILIIFPCKLCLRKISCMYNKIMSLFASGISVLKSIFIVNRNSLNAVKHNYHCGDVPCNNKYHYDQLNKYISCSTIMSLFASGISVLKSIFIVNRNSLNAAKHINVETFLIITNIITTNYSHNILFK